MKFPQQLLKVLGKTNPEIHEIHVINHEEFPVVNSITLKNQYKFLVNLGVILNRNFNDYNTPRMIIITKYEELIGSLFKMSFPDNDNVTISVVDLNIPPEIDPHSREEFFKIWG